MLDRIHGRATGRATPVGIVPDEAELDLKGLDLPKSAVRDALAVNPAEWKAELESAGEFFEKIGPTMPKELKERRQAILKSLSGEAPAQTSRCRAVDFRADFPAHLGSENNRLRGGRQG